MELVLGIVGVLLGAVALGVALQTRAALGRAHADLHQARTDLAESRTGLADSRAEVERLRAELEALRKKVDEPPPAPPLPRARHGGLDDLREQLRAAHAEATEAEEDSDE